ncbi:MAG: flagellar FlbD family protein [Firmicutes bacterium]|nr:flagellar FlbD family protein [Bacillota bacterium]MDD4263573.1 flagellar FlbD family protein [Bacillota bacterium]MDD4694442.1 flagellar FlbD family protein [Bacillota bacterium]
MIKLTKLDGKTFYLNSLLIETIEATPDTMITYAGGKKTIVQEDAAEVAKRIQTIRRNIKMLNV